MDNFNIDMKVSWINERTNDNDLNNGYLYGIYTYSVPNDEVGTDDQFNNDIIDVQWFKTKKIRNEHFKKQQYI